LNPEHLLSIRFLTFGVYGDSNIKLFKSGRYIFYRRKKGVGILR